MKTNIPPLIQRASWQALEAHYPQVRELHFRKLFTEDATRGERMAVEDAGIYFDYAKHRITDETLALLLQLAEESGLRTRIDAMLDGFHQMDEHFRTALFERNVPVLTGLLGLWHNNFFGAETLAFGKTIQEVQGAVT